MRWNRSIPVVGAFGVAAFAFAAPPVFTGPQPYSSIADSPYFGNGQSCFALEFFPDGTQSVPSLQINYATGASIVTAVGVPPGNHALQANALGVIELTFPTPVNTAGFVWTGGDSIGSTITLTVIAGTEAITQQYPDLAPNDPSNPADNRFFGVTWDVGIQTLRITFLPFAAGIPNQIDQIQFELPASECQTGQPDFNGDGWNDLVVQDPATGQVAVQALLDGQAAGIVTIPQPAGGVWNLATIGNFGTGVPGRDNIVWRNISTGTCVVWNMDGCLRTGGYTIQQPVSLNWRLVGTGDFDGDGVDDMVWQEEFQGTLVVWYMQNGQRASGQLFQSQSTPSWEAIGVGDFNADGTPDLVWRNVNTTALAVWFMGGANGTTRLGGASINQPAGLVWGLAGLSDLDLDGDLDMIWQNESSGAVVVWIMNGTTRESGYVMPLDVTPSTAWRVKG